MKVKKTMMEIVFGGDCHILRTTLRRILHLLLPFLFPFKKNRDKTKKVLDNWAFKLNSKKIHYFIEKYPDVRHESETIKNIDEKSLSIARFGDGELNISIGRSIGFQKKDKRLAVRLKEILNSKEKNILIGINTLPEVNQLSDIWKKFIIRRGYRVLRILDENRTYESSTITTTFPKDEYALHERALQLKKIWDKRNVVFVVGKGSRFFLSEELFDNISKHDFIYGPAKHAFSEYDRLLNEIRKKSTDNLILLSLGPTATVLAFDLAKLGYQAVDIGHMPSKYNRQRYGKLYPDPVEKEPL